MPDILNTLIKARNLIGKPENWCTHVFNITTQQGVSYCSRGAIFAALGFGPHDYTAWSNEDEPYCSELIRAFPYQQKRQGSVDLVADYNNEHSHKDVLAMFDKT